MYLLTVTSTTKTRELRSDDLLFLRHLGKQLVHTFSEYSKAHLKPTYGHNLWAKTITKDDLDWKDHKY